MTVLRREDVQSRVASWDQGPYRIASSPILAIVPRIIRRLRGPSATRVIVPFAPVDRVVWRQCVEVGVGWRAAHRNPASSRAIATTTLPAGLCCSMRRRNRRHSRCCALVRDRNHPARLSVASPRQGDADTRPVLIVPRRFHEQPADERVARRAGGVRGAPRASRDGADAAGRSRHARDDQLARCRLGRRGALICAGLGALPRPSRVR